MKTYLTLSAIALAAAATLSSGTVLAQAAAPAEKPDFVVTGNIGAVSDYRFRGLSQNNLNPAVQGGVDLAHSSGLYLGVWASQVSDWAAGPKGDNLEVDFYGGYKTEVSGVGLDVGAIAYHYPGSTTGSSTGKSYQANTQEVYVGLAYGVATFKTSYVISDNYFASSGLDNKGTMYYDLTLAKEVAPKLTASIHAGYTDYKKTNIDGKKFSYSDYNVGLAYDYEGFILGLKYHWNDAKAGTKVYADATGPDFGNGKSNLYKDGFVVSVTKAF
jgi:uncharacterized protein (TIGR02001 family)